jgi:nitrate/TMAO reductase-like tetraheme cytochrome c subunit
MLKNGKTDIRLLIGFLFVVFFAFGIFYLPSGQVIGNLGPKPTPTPRKLKYTEFPHSEKAHQLECGKCHKFPSDNWKKVRSGSAAFPDITDYPKHQSCIACHKQQFFRGTPPKICSICHTNPSPGDSSRHPYPNPREIFDRSPKGKNAESDFVVGFPHDKHIEIVSARTTTPTSFINAGFSRSAFLMAGEESCVVCHKTMAPQGNSNDEYPIKPPANLGDAFWLKKGTFKSSPIGHTVCFTCHSADTGILPASETCSACHRLKPPQSPADFDSQLAAKMIPDDKVMRDAWRIRHSAGAFRHEFFAHGDLSCSTCHNVSTMNTADPLTIKVPITACATCHVTPTSDDGGALNYEIDRRKENRSFQCVKCHITFGKLMVPRSHIAAIAAAAASPAATAK